MNTKRSKGVNCKCPQHGWLCLPLRFLEMTSLSSDSNKKDSFEDKLDEESVILTLVPVNEEHNEEHQMEPSVSSTSGAHLRMPGTDNIVYLPQMNGQFKDSPKPIFPLPTIFPSINKVCHDT